MQIISFKQVCVSLSIDFAMHSIKPLTAGTVKNNFNATIERFVASDNACWKEVLYDIVAMVNELGILTYFLVLSCADLRWEELLYSTKKTN